MGKFTKLRKTAQKQLQYSKNEHLMDLLDTNNQNSFPFVGKKFWGHVKNLKQDSTGVATLLVNGKEMVSGKEKANAFEILSAYSL